MNNNSTTFTWVLDTHCPPNNNDDLYPFLLQDSSEQPMDKSSSESISSGEVEYKSVDNKRPSACTTGRLDFRQMYDNFSDSQLKAMTSKERRQLRNKISARNFRNRRKEYVGTLETELDQQRAENSQLKLEIKWLKSKMEKLQTENDKLRLDLVLGPPVLCPTTGDENWDFVFPDLTQPDVFISQAIVPQWNNVFLSKEQEHRHTSTDLIKQYPLLAPALMSIILSHTMTMSTDQLIDSAKLSFTPPLDKESKALLNLIELPNIVKEKERNEKVTEKPTHKYYIITWIQSTIYDHLCEMIANHAAKPIEEKPFLCRSYQKAMRFISA